ncbi:MAG: peptide chain release factor N(5)-glutamine methyltransferase [Planctomycetes bacterium]|nr:peptide chain release factor N(5)-glutamine methyltransferase [Planctomycetota bacterium]
MRPAASADTEGPWTTRRLLQWTTGFLSDRGVDSARLCAELLLAHVFGCERTRLYMEVDRPASAMELARLRELVKRAGGHEPVQYLVGETWFHARSFLVDRSTLIPRPATETLVGLAVDWARARGTPLRMLDVCTGSGCIAVSVVAALTTPRKGWADAPQPPLDAQAVATDLVPAALDLAARNAARHGQQDRVEFRQGDLFAALRPDERGIFDLVTANPPYVSDAEWSRCAPNVRDHEPVSALRGGPDGLRLIEPLLRQVGDWLRPGGRVLVEVAASQGDAVRRLVGDTPGLRFTGVMKDHEGLDRVLVADRA